MLPTGLRLLVTWRAGRIYFVMRRLILLTPWLLVLPAALWAQTASRNEDARLPRQGQLWLETHTSFENWRNQFAEASRDPTISDGDREPLFQDFNGPILGRIFPSIQEGLLADLNLDAAALGFDPLASGDLSIGELDFGTLNVQVTRIDLALRYGIFDRLSLEVGAPFVLTEVEPFFAFDSASATVAPISLALPNAASLLSGLESVQGSLQSLIDGGGLSTEDAAAAQSLLASSMAFLGALQLRLDNAGFVPLGSSAAGVQMAAHFASLGDSFAAFGLTLPALALLDVASSDGLRSFFTGDLLSAFLPGATDRGFDVGEAEVGLRLGLRDNFGDTTANLHLRTTVGAKLRFPIKDVNRPPFLDPNNFLDFPIGDGQTDLELAAYQDLQLGDRFHLNAVAFLGIQMSDDVILRVHPPDRPFALPETRAALKRDLGDYVQLRIAPQYMLTDVISMGLEYGFWHKGSDTFRLLEGETTLQDPAVLELETSQTLHRLGFGAFYRPGAPVRGGNPWMIGFTFKTALSGSGGQTPVSDLFTVTLRIPI